MREGSAPLRHQGTTLEMVAKEAGLARSLIRHYVGNRDAMLVRWVERAVGHYRGQIDLLLSALPRRNGSQVMIDYLFQDEQSESDRVMDVVLSHAARHEESRALIADFIEHLIETIAVQLEADYPEAGPERCIEAASGIAAIAMSAESLSALRLQPRYVDGWRAAAHRMRSGLAATPS